MALYPLKYMQPIHIKSQGKAQQKAGPIQIKFQAYVNVTVKIGLVCSACNRAQFRAMAFNYDYDSDKVHIQLKCLRCTHMGGIWVEREHWKHFVKRETVPFWGDDDDDEDEKE